MVRARTVVFGLLAALTVGCEDDDGNGEEQEGRLPLEVTVMTQNLDIGTDVNEILSITGIPMLPSTVDRLFEETLASDFPARAEALADQIAMVRPHLIGLQEVVLIRTQTPGDLLSLGAQPAMEVQVDFLQTLLAALQSRQLDYRAAAVVDTFDVEVPGTSRDVRVTDRTVILAAPEVTVSDVEEQTFARSVDRSLPFTNMPLRLGRGWVAMDVSIGGRFAFRIANTHLEGANPEEKARIQLEQARQVNDAIRDNDGRLVLVGDFNSAADRSTSPTYGFLIDDGWTDAWAQVNPQDPGFTCCRDLADPGGTLTRRIDLVLLRDDAPNSGFRATSARLIGAEPASRTPSGLWIADHAGVAATLTVP